MPRSADHALLSWRDGAPYVTNARPEDVAASGYSTQRRVLRLETGWFSADIDTERVDVSGFRRHLNPRSEARAEASVLAAEALPDSRLRLAIVVGDSVFACTGRREVDLDRRGQPRAPLEFPARLIESGRFFQKLALHHLEFRDGVGRELRVAAHLEIAAWPDRLALTLVVRPEERLAVVRADLQFQTHGGVIASLCPAPATWEANTEHRCVLTLDAGGSAMAPVAAESAVIAVTPHDARAGTSVQWNREEMCHEVILNPPPWPPGTSGAYPAAMLDAFESYGVVVENASDVAQPIALRFTHSAFGGLTGCVPMLLDNDGNPTGIPVQISKNWHLPRSEVSLPHAGRWLHGRTCLQMPARSRVRLQYGTTFARWGGVPSASVAQLSLVGWGHNGFWDQFALGSFGESVCFQPLRVQRRSLFTDIRPLYQLGMARGDQHAWTSNVGGLDTMVRLDPDGRYVPFKRNVTRYVSHGPNLAELHYADVSEDEAVQSRVEVRVPRTDDIVRVYLRVRYDVRRPLRFSRLALFQLGADFYNSCDAKQIAFGNAESLAAEHSPKPSPGVDLPRWKAEGPQPWVSLHGQPRDDRAAVGQATRGVVVREWHATLGGRAVDSPWFAASRGLAPNRPLGAEIIPPPDVQELRPGDFVEMLLELVVFPLVADRYYGPDEPLRAALAEGANTWRPVRREAAGNRPIVTLGKGRRVSHFPLTVWSGSTREIPFALEGGLGWVPIRFTGLERPDGMELVLNRNGSVERVVQGPAPRAFWQADYDAIAARWTMTYNLPAPATRTMYTLRTKSVDVLQQRSPPAIEMAR